MTWSHRLLVPVLLASGGRAACRQGVQDVRVRVFLEAGCVGEWADVTHCTLEDSSDGTCAGCWDTCGKRIGGVDAHGSESAVRSIRVLGGGSAKVWSTYCFGMYEYPESAKAEKLVGTFRPSNGCVEFGAGTPHADPPTHIELLPRPRRAQRQPAVVGSSWGEPALPADPQVPADLLTSDGHVRSYRGRLQCPKHPYGDTVVYWKDVPADQGMGGGFFMPDDGVERFVTFETDHGGWNNIRMHWEVVVVYARATGRTLVIPPALPMYLLGSESLSYTQHYNMRALTKNLRVITTEEFIRSEIAGGRLEKEDVAQLAEIDGDSVVVTAGRKPLERWLRSTFKTVQWVPTKDLVTFPVDSGVGLFDGPPDETQQLKARARFKGTERAPLSPVNAEDLSQHRVVHFPSRESTYRNPHPHRYLVHWYAFLHFVNATHNSYFKRWVRDNLRYKDSILCKAAHIAGLLREEGGGTFHAMHVRHGEYQQKQAIFPASAVIKQIEGILKPGDLIYVATDEKNKEWFDPLRQQGYRLRFYGDFVEAAGLADVSPSHVGMVETMVAVAADRFIGTYWSTFTGYITRLRMYAGRRQTFYFMKEYQKKLWEDSAPTPPVGWWQEWPEAWIDIDNFYGVIGDPRGNS